MIDRGGCSDGDLNAPHACLFNLYAPCPRIQINGHERLICEVHDAEGRQPGIRIVDLQRYLAWKLTK